MSFNLIAYRIYLAGLFLLPTAIVLSSVVPLQSTKLVIATVALIGALAFSALGALKRGALTLPMNALLGAVWLIPIAYFVSALFSPSFQLSLVGAQIDMDTVVFMGLLALAASLPLYIFSSKSDVARAFFVILVAGWIVALFHLVRLFLGADVLSFGIFTNPLFSPLGKWNDVSIFFGLVSLLSLVTIESFPLQALHRQILTGTLVVSLFFVALVNFLPVWTVLGVISLGIALYRFMMPGTGTRYSIASIVVFVLAVCAIIFTSTLGAGLSQMFGVGQIEARPSWGSTLTIASQVLAQSPFLGSGPNTFTTAWDLYRPLEINTSVFWNADFSSGVGLMPTTLITVGGLGALVWLILLVCFVVAGVRGLLLKPSTDTLSYHLMLAAFVGALYILVMSVWYLPSPQLMLIGFALMGMFAALYHREIGGRTIDIDFRAMPRLGFVSVLGLALTLVVCALTLYGVGTVYASTIQFERSARAAQVNGDLAGATTLINSANSLHAEDRYYRFATLVHIAELNTALNAGSSIAKEEAQTKFQAALGAAVESGLKAVSLNNHDYRNWQTLSAAYQSVVPLNIDGAYDAAIGALKDAAVLNPTIPSVPLARAQIELAKQNKAATRLALDEALKLKEDYIPALLLLAQVELTDGNIKEAIKRAESASVFEPSNSVTKFQVGVLKFENKDYSGAKEAFAAAVALAPDYANARYYLGRTHLKLGNTADALAEFKEVLKNNADNADVKSVIASIEAGKDPFAPAEPEKKK